MSSQNDLGPVVEAMTLLFSHNLPLDLEFLSSLGFQLHTIHPDDDPKVAVLKGHGATLQLRQGQVSSAGHGEVSPSGCGKESSSGCGEVSSAGCGKVNPSGHGEMFSAGPGKVSPTATIILATDDEALLAKQQVTAPCGAVFKFETKTYKIVYPPTAHQFEVCLSGENANWVTGRAGMLYRDLLPSRLGGAISASHIKIPQGGPVPDMVHFHTIGFQLIYCLQGWVKLVYEDQGPPFILRSGDCVTQPREIRHRVLEASDGLEVVEVGVPATHMTTIDHTMTLPTQEFRPSREFSGQVFCHHRAEEAVWMTGSGGIEIRETGVKEATRGLASVRIVRMRKLEQIYNLATHDADIYWCFVLGGAMQMELDGANVRLEKGDAFAVPPGKEWRWKNRDKHLQFLEVALPGNFNAPF